MPIPEPQQTFHRRKLPPPAIEFSSREGQAIFREALAAGTMGPFFRLIEQFHTQNEPAFCGLGTLTMVLNALNVDPGKTWKGPWRWFHEGMLDCCEPLDRVKEMGIVWPKWVCLARCNGAYVDARRADDKDASLECFRQFVLQTSSQEVGCSTEEGAGNLQVLVCSYSRKQFGQTGDGHYSPIGGFHAGKDLVLILDVARFKHPPHWVPLEELYKSMQRQDPATNRARGFAVLSSKQLHRGWLSLVSKFGQRFAIVCASEATPSDGAPTIQEVASAFCQSVADALAGDEGENEGVPEETERAWLLLPRVLRAALAFCDSPKMPLTVVVHEAACFECRDGSCCKEATRQLKEEERERQEGEQRNRELTLQSLRDVAKQMESWLGHAPDVAVEQQVAQVLAIPLDLWKDALKGSTAFPLLESKLKLAALPEGMRCEVQGLRGQFRDLLTRSGDGSCECC